MSKFYLNLVSVCALLACISCAPTSKDLVTQVEIDSNWTFRQVGTDEWLPAQIPGCVHTDLLANGKIEDPFYRLNEHDLQWIDKEDWEYKTTFDVDKATLKSDRITLDFKGLDTYADVMINDKPVLSADNMFREWMVDVKEFLQPGSNELRIIFRSPITEGLKKYDANEHQIPVSDNDLAEIGQVEGGKKVSVYTRKAGYHFGWDWGPRLVSSGLWRPVFLTTWNTARIENVQFVQNSVSEEVAKLTARFEIESEANKKATLTIENDGIILATQSIKLEKGTQIYNVDFKIDNPKLWWTNGLGEAHLYNLKAKVTVGKASTELNDRIGIRTIELVRDKDEHGTTFYFKVNGTPVFMKGANYIPNDVFPARVTDDMYRNVINTAKTSNMNMLRIWGGGIYEYDIFYDLCDEAGILVWQDFMFACAMFPGDEQFLENVKAEAIDNIKRLRNHPSIAMWCGNNEILAAWFGWGWKNRIEQENPDAAKKIWKSYSDIFLKVLPEAVAEYDSQRFYWDSSPASGFGIPADLVNGDEHYWGVWWGQEPFKNYETHLARFMSEYGFQSFPELKTVKKYALPEDYDIFSEVMKSHQRSSIGNGTIANYMKQHYKTPKDFEKFLYVNHLLQAEGIKIAIEAHRRAAPYNMGTLYWQINDVWPVASWSSTDYYQEWKALQYFVKKAFEPILVAPVADDQAVKVDIINDYLTQFDAQLIVKVIDTEGKEIKQFVEEVQVPANSSETFFNTPKAQFLKGVKANQHFAVVELMKDGNVVSRNTLFFNNLKDFNLPKAEVHYEIAQSDNGFDISLTSSKLAKNAFLTIGDEKGFFSDNYFDILPGEIVKVKLTTQISKDKLNEVFAIQTLDQSY
jgi:beta-mannosidase